MRKGIPIIIIAAIILSMGLAASAAAAPTEKMIFRLQALGIIDEYEAEREVTRGEAVDAFVRMLVESPAYTGETGFSDVPADSEYASAVYYAKQIGIINGTGGGLFSPDDKSTGYQIAKMAVVTLGYQMPAEEAGGYEGGYVFVATQQGLLTGYSLEGNVKMSEFAVLLDKMLDMNMLEPSYGTSGDYVKSEQTIYEKIIDRSSKESIKGIVTAVGNSALNGYKTLNDDEISIGDSVFKYYGENAYEMLGKNVNAYYREDDATGRILVVDILPLSTNSAVTIKSDDINTLSATSCVYEKNEDKTETLKIAVSASFIHNRSNMTPSGNVIKVATGEVTLLDRDDDEVYDVVFINEYESFVADRISEINKTVYFKKDNYFHGKTGFKFDYEDTDKKYYIYNSENEEITFEDIEAGNVITIESNSDETLNYVTVTDEKTEGVISAVTEDEEFVIGDETYTIYAPNAAEILADYGVGQEGVFYLNSKGEIVDGDVGADGYYGFVTEVSGSESIGTDAQIKIITAGASKKEVEVNGDEETIKYVYSNGEEKILNLASKIKYTRKTAGGSSETEITESVSPSSINWSELSRAVVCYKLNGEGKVNKLDVTPIDIYNNLKTRFTYELNGKLNSCGGYDESTRTPFFIGSTTNVICVPENDTPDEDDYKVDVTVSDESLYVFVPINVDDKTQVAECVILVSAMDANDPKPFSDTTKISIVGGVKRSIDAEGDLVYTVELLEGKDYKTPSLKAGSLMEQSVSKLKCGDLIQYNTNAMGEIANVSKPIASMYEYDTNYDVSGSGENEMVYGVVSSIELNRLDGIENEMVDKLTFNNLGGDRRTYKLLREDGPTIYSYKKSTGVIAASEADEIQTENEAGSEASKVFLYVSNNVVKCAVIFKD